MGDEAMCSLGGGEAVLIMAILGLVLSEQRWLRILCGIWLGLWLAAVLAAAESAEVLFGPMILVLLALYVRDVYKSVERW